MQQQKGHSAAPVGKIGVASDVTHDGEYTPVVHFTPDRSRTLTREQAFEYAGAVAAAAMRAEYDAAVMRQLTANGVSFADAGRMLADLRAERPTLDEAATAPLALIPGVSAQRGCGFIDLVIDGVPLGQWELTDAYRHVAHVMVVVEATRLDTAYRDFLQKRVGLNEKSARAAVGMLRLYSDTASEDSD